MSNAPAPQDDGWFSRQRVLAIALAIATLIAFYVCFLIIEPFIPPLAIALALAVSTNGPFQWLRGRLNDTWAAVVGVILVALVIIGPLTFLVTYVVQQVLAILRETQSGDLANWHDSIYAKPVIGNALRWAEANLDIQGQLAGLGKNLAGRAGVLVTGSISLITQLVIMLFVLFFMYRDKTTALAAIRRIIPLSAKEADDMLCRVGDTIHATVNGSLTVALAQALLAGTMYTILGVPAAMLWGSATFIVALVPVFGTVMVWGPIACYLLLTGTWVKALVLIGWGALAVGTIDNILYQTTHHGLDRSNSPAFIQAIQPQVMIMNNGPRKGGQVSVFETFRKSPGLQDIWQGHLALAIPKEVNTDEKMIANLEPTAQCTGNLLKVSVESNGKYTVTNARNNYSKTYQSK